MLPVELRPVVRQRAAPLEVRRRRAGTPTGRPGRRPLRQATVARPPSVAIPGPAEPGLSVDRVVPRPLVLVGRVAQVDRAPRPQAVADPAVPTPASIPGTQPPRPEGLAALRLRPIRLRTRPTPATRTDRARPTRVPRPPASPRVGSARTPASMSAARILAS